MPAPIALFAYRRAQHLERTIEALRTNPEARDTSLYVYSDGAKDESATENVEQVRLLLGRIDGFADVHRVFRDKNYGLAQNITGGVSDVLGRHDAVIVVEDDILVSPFYLRFMNDALSYYQGEERVGSISGYCYPVACAAPETYFIRGADCWGWATWRSRWQFFNSDGRDLLAQLRRRKLTQEFDFDGAMGFTRMLEDQIAGKNDSWAVRWHASCFLRDFLILYPGRPLAENIGFDGSGTHCDSSDRSFDVNLSPTSVSIRAVPVEENVAMRAAIRDFFLHKRASAGSRRLRDMKMRLQRRFDHLVSGIRHRAPWRNQT